MTVRNFSQLVEMLEPGKVELRMSMKTHKYIIGIGFTIDPDEIKEEDMKDLLDGIKVVHVQIDFKSVEFIPTFTPRIGDGFTITLH